MTFQVKVYITGLCMIVPITDRQGKLTEVQIQFPDARQPRLAGMSPHQPMLQYALKNKRSHDPRFPLFQDAFDEIQGLLLLSDRDWSWSSEEGPLVGQSNFQCSPEGVLGNVPVPANAADMGWVAQVMDASGKLGTVKRGLCLPQLDVNLAEKYLSARIRFQAGTWRVSGFSRSMETNQFLQWRVNREKASLFHRAVANVIEVTMDVDGESLDLDGFGFDGKKAQPLVLAPAPEVPNAPVELWVMNREMDLVVHQYFSRSINLDMERSETSFRFFYELLETPPEKIAEYLPTARSLLGDVKPGCLRPCRGRGMKRLYFPEYEGQTSTNHAYCYPGMGQGSSIP